MCPHWSSKSSVLAPDIDMFGRGKCMKLTKEAMFSEQRKPCLAISFHADVSTINAQNGNSHQNSWPHLSTLGNKLRGIHK